MNPLLAEIGYESLRFHGPFQPQRIEQLQINRAINEHAYVQMTGLLSEEQGSAWIGQAMEQEPIVIHQLDEHGQPLRRLFHGIVTHLSVHAARGIYTFELEAASHSYQMDIRVKTRSYPDIHRTYEDLVTTMVRKYAYGDLIDTVTRDVKLGAFVLQYEETDWAFFKRLASRFGSVLVPEVTAASPKIFFGMPEGKPHHVEREISYQVRKTFHEPGAGKPGGRAGPYVTYTLESLYDYALGDLLTLPIGPGKELVVVRAVTTLADGLLRTRYELQAETDIRYARYENDRATGISLTGTVLKVQQDFMQLQLDIDAKQDSAKACWFPAATRYAAEEHGGWYDMPEIGEQVNLYLPTNREQDAYVTDSLRQQRHVQGPGVKVWRHAQGSGLEMSEQELTLSTSGNLSVILHEDQGITVSSPGNVQLHGGHVNLKAGQTLSLEAGTALHLKGGASSMVLDGETDTHAPVIHQAGTVKAPVFVADLPPIPEPPLMSLQAYQEAQAAQAAQASAAAQESSGSSAGSAPAAKVTPPAEQKQAGGLLGTVSKLLGSIPAVGKVAGALLRTLGGPVGKVAATVLQATGAIPVRSTGTSRAGSGGATGTQHPLKHLAGLALQGLISHYEHEQAKQAYYSKWMLGKVFTSARHIAHSGGPLEIVKSLLNEANALQQAYHQIPQEVTSRWKANYDRYTAQQQAKPQAEPPKSWWRKVLEQHGQQELMAAQAQMEQADTIRDVSKKSANSLVQLAKGFYDAAAERNQKKFDSVGAFLDYLSVGIPKGMYLSYEERASKAFDSPNDVANWLTFGVHGTIREAFSPEDAWSPEHWSNIIGTIGIMEGARSFFKPKPKLKVPAKKPGLNAPEVINEKAESPQASNSKPNKGIEAERTGKGGVGKTGEGIPLEKLKPNVQDQIHRNNDAAYGYSPNKGTVYDRPEYDFTDIEWAKKQQKIRTDYLEASKQLETDIARMQSQGFSKEDIAHHVVEARNQQKVNARQNMTDAEVAGLEARNIKKYGNPVGPTADNMFEKTKQSLLNKGLYTSDDQIWEVIINKSMEKDDVINTLLGLEH